MFFVYVLSSITKNYIYVGLTSDLERRISDHNNGYNKTTKAYSPFKIIFVEEHSSRIAARSREKYLKSGIGKEYIRKVILNTSNNK